MFRVGAWEVRTEKNSHHTSPKGETGPVVSTVPGGGTSKRLGAGPSSVELSATPKSFAGRGSPGEKLPEVSEGPPRGLGDQIWVGATFRALG